MNYTKERLGGIPICLMFYEIFISTENENMTKIISFSMIASPLLNNLKFSC